MNALAEVSSQANIMHFFWVYNAPDLLWKCYWKEKTGHWCRWTYECAGHYTDGLRVWRDD